MPSPAGTTASVSSVIGYGTDLATSTTQGGTYTSLAQIEDISQPNPKVTKVDKTGLLSPSATREKAPGLVDSGEIKFKLIFGGSTKATLMGYLQGRTLRWWKITYPDGATTSSTDVFQGFVSEISGEVPLDDNVMCDVEITITGPITFTAGS